MSRGVNKVILIGNLGNDPEIRNMPNGSPVTQATLATSETWKDKNSGQQQERTEWHRLVFFNRLAEITADYCKKGSQIYIEGALRTRKWQDKDGTDRYTTEIIVSEMQMLGSVRDKQNSDTPRTDNRYGIANEPPQQNANSNTMPPPDFNDDIPF